MKKKREDEKLVNFGFRLPTTLIERIKESAFDNRRSMNNEAIVLLEFALNELAMRENIGQEHLEAQGSWEQIDASDANRGVVDLATLGLK